MEAKFYLCATPIGNLADITLRVLEALRECACIYAEDTRHTRKLLNHFEITTPLLSCHAHNEAQRAQEIAARVLGGDAICYVSDAGMPGISDPGARLVKTCIELCVPYTVLPGASASLSALVLSGLSTENACFVGFLPREKGERNALLSSLARHYGTLIFYESPLRIAQSATEMHAMLGERECVLVREVSKLHEECFHATLSALASRYADAPPKGECVLLVAGAQAQNDVAIDARELIEGLLSSGMGAKDAAKHAFAVADIPRNEAYALALDILDKK